MPSGQLSTGRIAKPKQGPSGATIGVLFLLVAIGCYLYSVDWGLLDGQITDYAITCTATLANGQCTGSWTQEKPTTYSVNFAQQTVVSQMEGQPPNRLMRCAVVNRTNWKCYLETEKNFAVGFTDGVFYGQWEGETSWGTVGPPASDLTRHVSRFYWLATSFTEPRK
jgi:hypothetical protein